MTISMSPPTQRASLVKLLLNLIVAAPPSTALEFYPTFVLTVAVAEQRRVGASVSVDAIAINRR